MDFSNTRHLAFFELISPAERCPNLRGCILEEQSATPIVWILPEHLRKPGDSTAPGRIIKCRCKTHGLTVYKEEAVINEVPQIYYRPPEQEQFMKVAPLYHNLIDQALTINEALQDEHLKSKTSAGHWLRDFGTVYMSIGRRCGTSSWIEKRMESDPRVGALINASMIPTYPAFSRARMFAEVTTKLRDFRLLIVDNSTLNLSYDEIQKLTAIIGTPTSEIKQLLVLGH